MATMENLFGSGSDDSDGNVSSPGEQINEGMPSTQTQMKDLFGESDASKDSSDSSSDDEKGQGDPTQDPDEDKNSELNFQSTKDVDDDDDVEQNVEQQQRQQPLSSDDSDIGEGHNETAPTTQDLFGEEVSSDDDEPITKEEPSTFQEEDDGNSSSSPIQRKRKIEKPPSPTEDSDKEDAEDEGLSISIELPRCNISLGKELYFVKLPNFLSVDTKPFDPNFYEDISSDEDEILDEEGRARLKLKVENTIRWRYSKDKDGEEIKESNCRFVRWSDGSLSMHLGNEVFDVFKMKVDGEQNHLFVQQGTGLQAQAVFKNKLSFRPHSTASQTHRKMTMSIADRMNKAQKVKMMPAMEKDPESQRESALKKEDERLRAASRRESQQRRMREKNHLKGLSSSYLNEDDEDRENSISAIKADVNNKSRRVGDIYGSDDDDEDSDNEDELRKAKLDVESDDEDDDFDPEIRAKREELARNKKKGGRKIIESDEESD